MRALERLRPWLAFLARVGHEPTVDPQVVALKHHALPVIQSEDVPQVDWAGFVDALESDDQPIVRFTHLESRKLTQQRPELNVRIFGFGNTENIEAKLRAERTTPPVQTYIADGGVILPSSMITLDKRFRIFEDSKNYIPDPKLITQYDWNFILSDNNMIMSDQFLRELRYMDVIGMPLCGPGFSNYGHFLFDGLPVALMLKNILPEQKICLFGQELRPWQRELLDLLGLLPDYVEVLQPIQFRKLIFSSMMGSHVPYPSRFLRPVFDTLRFRVGAHEATTPERIFISRRGVSKRPLRNRTDVEALVEQHGFAIVCPNEMSIPEQVRMFSGARFVVAEAGAGIANVGFCEQGAIVLEIAAIPDPWTRGTCQQLGLHWACLIADVYSAADDETPSDDKPSLTVNLEALHQAISTLDANPALC